MNDGASSTDQSDTSVDKGIQPRASSLPDTHGSDASHNSNDINNRIGLDEKHDRIDSHSDSNEDRSQFARFRSRRSLAWYQNRELLIVLAITVLALVVRLWAIGYPTSVV